jgi:hypothetical protein
MNKDQQEQQRENALLKETICQLNDEVTKLQQQL